MTLHLVISNPSKTALYGAQVEVLNRTYDTAKGEFLDEYYLVEEHRIDPGQACEVWITEVSKLNIVEYALPKITPIDVTPDRVVTIDEAAHGHE